MDDDQVWSLSELKEHIQDRHGKEHAERAWLSIQSVPQRLDHVAFHLRELSDCTDRVRSAPKREMIRRMFEKDDGLNEIVLHAAAHAIAGAQALHAVTDILGSAVYLSLRKVSQWEGNLMGALKALGEPYSLMQLAKELRSDKGYQYLDAIVNQSKHRNVIHTPFLMPMSSDAPPRFEFENFERNKKFYPATDALLFMSAEHARQHEIIYRFGIILNKMVKETESA